MAATDPSLCKTPLGETGCLGNPYFTYWLPKHPVFWFTLTLTQSVRLLMVAYPSLCSICVTYRTLCCAIGHKVLPNQPLPREAEDFPRSDNHSNHVPLPTYLAWLQPIYYNSWIHIYTCQNCKNFDCREDFNKKNRAAATLISSHESKN